MVCNGTYSGVGGASVGVASGWDAGEDEGEAVGGCGGAGVAGFDLRGGVDNAVGLVADGGWNGVVGAEGNTGIGVAGVAAAAGLRTGAGTGTGACIPGLRCGRAGGAAAMIVDRLAALCWYSCAFAEDG